MTTSTADRREAASERSEEFLRERFEEFLRERFEEFLRERFEETLWSRHANPASGWTRLPTGPVLVYAVYRRDWLLLLASLVWAAVDPFLFPSPETDEAWMTRGVLAERWWVREEGRGTMGLSYPNVCNAASALSFAYALLAAWRKRPVGTTLGSAVAFGLKLWWVGVLVRRYDARSEAEESVQ